MSDDLLRVAGLHHQFGAETVLRGVDLTLGARQTMSILGRSGSGKTTLLKIIAGLEAATSGSVHLEQRDLSGVPPEHRNVVYLYQEPLLFPHLSVFDNVAFGLRMRRLPRAQVRERTLALIEELGLAPHTTKLPHELSGGQRQRTAFGRALIVQPRLLLLDEPFGALDADTRSQMQALFRRVVHAQHIAALFVTHDLKEAILVGDQYAHLAAGRLTQYPELQSFLADPASKAAEEMAFWAGLSGRATATDTPG